MTYAPPCPTQTQRGATVHDFPAPTSAPDSGFMGLSTKQHRFQAISTPRDNLNSNLDNLLCRAMSYIQIPIIPPISGEIWGWFTVNALPTVPTMTSFTTPARSHFQWPLNEWRLGQISAAHSAEWSFSWRRVAKATSHEQNWWDANLAGLTVLDSLSGTNIWI